MIHATSKSASIKYRLDMYEPETNLDIDEEEIKEDQDHDDGDCDNDDMNYFVFFTDSGVEASISRDQISELQDKEMVLREQPPQQSKEEMAMRVMKNVAVIGEVVRGAVWGAQDVSRALSKNTVIYDIKEARIAEERRKEKEELEQARSENQKFQQQNQELEESLQQERERTLKLKMQLRHLLLQDNRMTFQC